MTEPTLPRLLFFRWTRPGQPQFLLNQLAEQLDCLRLFFDVRLVDEAVCDFDEACDRFQPDLVLFESGVYAGERRLTNVHTHPDIPRLGFLNADAFDPVRAAFVSDMARWGVETFFSVSVSMAEYTPEIADRLFAWPNFVDPRIHRDHGLPRVVPIVLTGSQARHYPWRNRVSRVLAQHHPVIAMPHFGWAESAGARRMSVGEAYSRLIGSALMAPSCGSFTRDLVRKHLEIPAARTCLIAERTPALEAAGYVDMVNCVFADADDVLDKVDHLLREPEELQAITDAGFRLVHARHTASQRRQLRDWYDLFAATGSAEGIVQDHPFAPLRRGAAPGARPHLAGPAPDRELIRRGWDSLRAGRHRAALRAFTGASNYQYMPEAEVGKAFTQLWAGEAERADATVTRLIGHNERLYGPVDPDPAQWATLVRALVCRGLLADAHRAVARLAACRHPELDRVRAVVAALTGGDGDDAAQVTAHRRPSVSPPPALTWQQWLEDLRGMLLVNGQPALAERLAGLAGRPDPGTGAGLQLGRPLEVIEVFEAVEAGEQPASRRAGRPVVRLPAAGLAVVRHGVARLGAVAAERAREAARRRVGAGWLDALSDAAEREELANVVVVGPSRWSLRERALRLALARNPRLPEVREVSSAAAASLDLGPGPTLVHLGRGTRATDRLETTLREARVVLVEGVVHPDAVRLVDGLLATGDFELLEHDTRHGGHAVLRHRLGAPPRRSEAPGGGHRGALERAPALGVPRAV